MIQFSDSLSFPFVIELLILNYLRAYYGHHLFMQILQDPVKIGVWAVVNFSTRVDMSYVSRQLINCGRRKGIVSHVQILASLIFQAFVQRSLQFMVSAAY